MESKKERRLLLGINPWTALEDQQVLTDREEVEALAEHSTAGKGRSAHGTAQEALAEMPGET